jgi:hypothetical protein
LGQLTDNCYKTSLLTADYASGVVASVAVLAVLCKKFSLANGKNTIPFPPGPPARWFWSNALPSVNIAHALTDLVWEYGPVVLFRQGSQVIIVIGSVKAITSIMEAEGRSLVDRRYAAR